MNDQIIINNIVFTENDYTSSKYILYLYGKSYVLETDLSRNKLVSFIDNLLNYPEPIYNKLYISFYFSKAFPQINNLKYHVFNYKFSLDDKNSRIFIEISRLEAKEYYNALYKRLVMLNDFPYDFS